MVGADDRPRLRPLEVRPSQRRRDGYDVFDPSGIADGVLTLSDATAFIVSRMDGLTTRVDIQAAFMRHFGRMLFSDEIDSLIDQLDRAHFLESAALDAHMAALTRQYRTAAARPIRDAASLGAPLEDLAAYFDEMLNGDGAPARTRPAAVVGLIAPHLDYDRGRPCYAAAYHDLAIRTDATRFVILGTNHFGRSASVVGTRRDFETPFGIVPCDHALMGQLDERCGVDLCDGEYDHAREHSIELQVLLLKHVLGDRRFTIAPFLCPDPCGPTGTAPREGRGVDLRDFAAAIRAEADDAVCVIAGADLSHVGRYFHDPRELGAAELSAVESSDRAVLRHVAASDPDALLKCVRGSSNATNICSIGCIFVLVSALANRAAPRLLDYHQAVTTEAENCVTCCAAEFTRP